MEDVKEDSVEKVERVRRLCVSSRLKLRSSANAQTYGVIRCAIDTEGRLLEAFRRTASGKDDWEVTPFSTTAVKVNDTGDGKLKGECCHTDTEVRTVPSNANVR